MSKKKKTIIISISILIIIIIVGIIIGIFNYKKNQYAYINKKGDKYTEEQLSTIKINNMRIENYENQLKQDEEQNLGTLTEQAQKDIDAMIPSVQVDSYSNITELQKQLLSNLQQDIASN